MLNYKMTTSNVWNFSHENWVKSLKILNSRNTEDSVKYTKILNYNNNKKLKFKLKVLVIIHHLILRQQKEEANFN